MGGKCLADFVRERLPALVSPTQERTITPDIATIKAVALAGTSLRHGPDFRFRAPPFYTMGRRKGYDDGEETRQQ